MKKTLLLLAALCCAVTSWAGWRAVDTNPSLSYSKISNIRLDSANYAICFTDNYAQGTAFYERIYQVEFYLVGDSTSWYIDDDNLQSLTYGVLRPGASKPTNTIVGFEKAASINETFPSNAGGDIVINCKKNICELLQLGANQFMIAIACSYRLTSEDRKFIYYSNYNNFEGRYYPNSAIFDMPAYKLHTVEFYYCPATRRDQPKDWEPKLYKSYTVLDGERLDAFESVPTEPETEFTIKAWYNLDRDQEILNTGEGGNMYGTQLSTIFEWPIRKDYKFMAAEDQLRVQIYKEDYSPGQVGYRKFTGEVVLGNMTELHSFDDVITITAVPDEGAYFYGWSDGDMNPTRRIYIHRHTYLRAYFGKTPISYPITVGGIPVTQANQNDVLGDRGAGVWGSVVYDPTLQKLIIRGDVNINGGAGSGITFDGTGYINPNFTLSLGAPLEINAQENGIKTTAANLTIVSDNYRTDMFSIMSDRAALVIDGDLTFQGTRVYAIAEHDAAIKLTFHTMTVDSSFVLMQPATGVPTCNGISELNMINAKFLTEGVSFYKPWMTLVDDETGNITTKQVSIKPFVTYPLTIGGIAVTSDNCNDVLGDGGSVVYNVDGGTIYIHKDVTIENETGNGITFDGECYIILLADCNIQAKGYGIEATNGLTIQTTKENSHTLNIESDKEAIKSTGGDCLLLNASVSAVSALASAIDVSDHDLAVINSDLYMANKSNSEAVCKGVNYFYTKDCYIETKGVSFSAEKKGLVDDATGLLTTNPVTIKKGSEPTDIHTISNDANAATYQKFLHNGVLYIQKNGQIYSVMGERIQ